MPPLAGSMNEILFDLIFLEIVRFIKSTSFDLDGKLDTDTDFYRIERIGFEVGLRIIEKLLLKLNLHTRLVDQLDIFKLICKEFWELCFHKIVDNLKTNHKGMFVIHDNQMNWMQRFISEGQENDATEMAILVNCPLLCFFF